MLDRVAFPPPRHLLRDLRLDVEFGEGGRDARGRAWLPVVPEVCGDDRAVRAGVAATLVDVIGGGLAVRAAYPDWIATADLTLHLVRPAREGTLEARASVLRAGRTTVVLEVDLGIEDAPDDDPIGLATMSFGVLPRREGNAESDALGGFDGAVPRLTMALPESSLDENVLDAVGIRVVDGAAGVVEAPVTDYSCNSFGALQGGVVATLVEVAAEQALRAATGVPVVAVDLQLTYLALGRVGPLHTRTEVLAASAAHGVARVEVFDPGREGRCTTIGRVVAARAAGW